MIRCYSLIAQNLERPIVRGSGWGVRLLDYDRGSARGLLELLQAFGCCTRFGVRTISADSGSITLSHAPRVISKSHHNPQPR